MPATTVYQLPYPAASDPADVPTDMHELADAIEAKIAPGSASGQVPVWDNANKKWVGQAKAPDAELLDGLDSTAFLRTAGKAADADKLDGLDSTVFLGGAELGYGENTVGGTLSATGEPTAGQVLALPALSFDGATTIEITAHFPELASGQAASNTCWIYLFDGGSSMGLIGVLRTTAASQGGPMSVARRLVPPAGSHTYSIRISVTGGTFSMAAGPGGAGVRMPAYMRATRV